MNTLTISATRFCIKGPKVGYTENFDPEMTSRFDASSCPLPGQPWLYPDAWGVHDYGSKASFGVPGCKAWIKPDRHNPSSEHGSVVRLDIACSVGSTPEIADRMVEVMESLKEVGCVVPDLTRYPLIGFDLTYDLLLNSPIISCINMIRECGLRSRMTMLDDYTGITLRDQGVQIDIYDAISRKSHPEFLSRSNRTLTIKLRTTNGFGIRGIYGYCTIHEMVSRNLNLQAIFRQKLREVFTLPEMNYARMHGFGYDEIHEILSKPMAGEPEA